MKSIHSLLVLAVVISFLSGYFLARWTGKAEISQFEQSPSMDLPASPKPIDSQDKASTIVDRENPLKSGNSGNQTDKSLISPKIDEGSESREEAYSDLTEPEEVYSGLTEPEEENFDPLKPHELPLPDEQTLALQKLEQEAALEELAESMRTNGLPEEDIEAQIEGLASLSETKEAEPPREGPPIEELEAELEYSLMEAGVPDEDIDNMIEELFYQTIDSQFPPPPPDPEGDQAPDAQ
jgi:hypothetical protein